MLPLNKLDSTLFGIGSPTAGVPAGIIRPLTGVHIRQSDLRHADEAWHHVICVFGRLCVKDLQSFSQMKAAMIK